MPRDQTSLGKIPLRVKWRATPPLCCIPPGLHCWLLDRLTAEFDELWEEHATPNWFLDLIERVDIDREADPHEICEQIEVGRRASRDERYVEENMPVVNEICRRAHYYEPVRNDPIITRMGTPSEAEIEARVTWELLEQLKYRWRMHICPIALCHMEYEQQLVEMGFPLESMRMPPSLYAQELREQRQLSRSRTPQRRVRQRAMQDTMGSTPLDQEGDASVMVQLPTKLCAPLGGTPRALRPLVRSRPGRRNGDSNATSPCTSKRGTGL